MVSVSKTLNPSGDWISRTILAIDFNPTNLGTMDYQKGCLWTVEHGF